MLLSDTKKISRQNLNSDQHIDLNKEFIDKFIEFKEENKLLK